MRRSERVSPQVLVAVLVFLAVESTAVASLGTPLLPTIERVDHVSLGASQWALTITLLVGAVAAPSWAGSETAACADRPRSPRWRP